MKPVHLASVALVALSFLAGCGKPTGTYKLDKEAIKTAFKAELEKKSDEDKKMGEFGLALVDMLDVTLEVKDDGKYDMKTSMPSLTKKDEKKEETESGDWSVEGDTITLKGKEEMKCKVGSGKLECGAKGKDGPPLIFKKS